MLLSIGWIGLALAIFGGNGALAQSLCQQGTPTNEGELVQPLVCSRDLAATTAPVELCEVKPLLGSVDGKRVQVNLVAASADIKVGGYRVKTENYNGCYMPPVVEVAPGDLVAAKLTNSLEPRTPSDPSHAGHDPNANPTNLHYFHGGIVTPKNARRANDPNDEAASLGNGDNVFVYLKPGPDPFIYEVPIPKELDARVLEKSGVIPYPQGLNWYHSHLHGWSSDQVMGGLSGLLSVGNAKANVVACKQSTTNPDECVHDADATTKLKERTDVRYALLRDISLKDIKAPPESAADAAATWAPEDKHFRESEEPCKVWRTENGAGEEDKTLRKGYCQRNEKKAWLFTLNGQRYPKITVEGGRNLLLRLGNLSANVTYWLELVNEDDETDKLDLTLLAIDGVVPVAPVSAEENKLPVKAEHVPDLVLLPASRAEIYVRNDCRREKETTYILRMQRMFAGDDLDVDWNDVWPDIKLARLVLKKSTVECVDIIALNAATSTQPMKIVSAEPDRVAIKPMGCVDDIDPAKGEHRRVVFRDGGKTTSEKKTEWSILTEIMHPPEGATDPVPYAQFKPDLDKTVGIFRNNKFDPVPFEEYDLGDGKISWSDPNKRRVCVFLNTNDPDHKNSHQQLWVLDNKTASLHNFHIHQMKFRLATAEELTKKYKIDLTNVPASTCENVANCVPPAYQLYEKAPSSELIRWHDTIPMPPGTKVYVIMSFDAQEQVGRFVFHCHILKHEDNGLMAPIEVWTPSPVVAQQ